MTDVVMPQLGETVTEGTITRWFKAVGDSVAVDEPLFEVSTDKVDSEVPSPTAGVLTAIVVPEGDTVAVGVTLAVIGAAGDAPAPVPAPEPAPAAAAPAPVAAPPVPSATPAPAPPAPAAVTPSPPPMSPSVPTAPTPVASAAGAVATGVIASPIVRRLIAEHDLDGTAITGTGDGGRITRNDVLDAARARSGAPAAAPRAVAPAPSATPAVPPGVGDHVVPFDNIRKRTAEHMVRSKATSPHVYTSVEVDFERIERLRRRLGGEFKADEGFSLTYLPFVVRAFADAAREWPHVNASVDGESLVVHRDVNLGIAVDLDHQGLLAPVVRNVDGKRLRLIAREIRDLASRARSKQLTPDEISGGTFTITNMGPFGTVMTLPIINQPQVAILATDGVHKKPVVVEGPDGEDSIAIHHVGVIALAWDHRAFDGAYAASFLRAMKDALEGRDWESELA